MTAIQVKHVSGRLVTVDAFPCGVAGLAIHAAVPPATGWVITHVRAGLLVGWFPDADPEAVLAAAQALGDLADWSLPADDVADDATQAEVEDALERWGGTVTAPGSTRADSALRADIDAIGAGVRAWESP